MFQTAGCECCNICARHYRLGRGRRDSGHVEVGVWHEGQCVGWAFQLESGTEITRGLALMVSQITSVVSLKSAILIYDKFQTWDKNYPKSHQ